MQSNLEVGSAAEFEDLRLYSRVSAQHGFRCTVTVSAKEQNYVASTATIMTVLYLPGDVSPHVQL